VGAGGLRAPRRKGARVAAPSGCIVPWAARASCWPQPQQLLPVSAAGSGRRCCCSNPPLRSFCTADKTETPVPGSDTGVLGGRGWMSRAALLKTAHWAVFAPSSATAPQLFESTRSMSLALLQNKNLSVFAYVEVFWWSEATQIRTIALWGIFGGNFIESDGFCAVFIVECNQNFFIIEINRVHERVDKRLPVAFHVRVELAEPGQPETNLIFA